MIRMCDSFHWVEMGHVLHGSKRGGLTVLACTMIACSSPGSTARKDGSSPTMAGGSSGASSGGAGGSAGGGAGGTSLTDAASDHATSDAHGGAAGTSTSDGAVEASNPGDSAGTGEASMSDGAGGIDVGWPDAGDGSAGAPPACEVVLRLVDRGSWIAFDSDRDNLNRNLYLIHPDGTGLAQLTKGTNVDREPFFSYDGTHLSYTSQVAGQSQIFIMDLELGTSVQLTKRPEGADQSAFSRDGEWIAFHSGQSVYVIRTDGTGEKFIAAGENANGSAYWPVFSADGTELVVDRKNHIMAFKIDGTGSRYLLNRTTANLRMPAVSVSGDEVAYAGECPAFSPPLAIWSTPFAVTSERCLGQRFSLQDSGFTAERPTWGNGSVLAYHRIDRANGLGVIAMIARGDPRPCFLTAVPYDSRNPSWSLVVPTIAGTGR